MKRLFTPRLFKTKVFAPRLFNGISSYSYTSNDLIFNQDSTAEVGHGTSNTLQFTQSIISVGSEFTRGQSNVLTAKLTGAHFIDNKNSLISYSPFIVNGNSNFTPPAITPIFAPNFRNLTLQVSDKIGESTLVQRA